MEPLTIDLLGTVYIPNYPGIIPHSTVVVQMVWTPLVLFGKLKTITWLPLLYLIPTLNWRTSVQQDHDGLGNLWRFDCNMQLRLRIHEGLWLCFFIFQNKAFYRVFFSEIQSQHLNRVRIKLRIAKLCFGKI